jgi:phosphoglycolate phosphatase-like HAD superfamily hydrolase
MKPFRYMSRWRHGSALVLGITILAFGPVQARDDQLRSWNDGPTEKAIVEFVKTTTDKASPNYVPPDERIATFDNDGTLWAEQPMYVQALFAFDRVKALAPQHPEWQTREPFASVLKGDLKGALAGGDKALLEIVMATHAGMTTDEFQQIVKDWISTAQNPVTKRPVLDMVYRPMVELLAYLRANGYKTYIVSGGGIEFMRPWAEQAYGVPPEQVVGSSIKTKYELRDGKSVLVRLPELNFIDDKDGKPVGINQHIGHRPIAAFGNSDGDRQMLEYATSGSGPRFGMLVLHDDAKREFAYGPANGLPDSHVGTFTQGLYDEALRRGWIVISMKDDWKQVFPASNGETAR